MGVLLLVPPLGGWVRLLDSYRQHCLGGGGVRTAVFAKWDFAAEECIHCDGSKPDLSIMTDIDYGVNCIMATAFAQGFPA